jgi:hypothetical protein
LLHQLSVKICNKILSYIKIGTYTKNLTVYQEATRLLFFYQPIPQDHLHSPLLSTSNIKAKEKEKKTKTEANIISWTGMIK